ncbi:MAG TPA: aminoacyl-tRNA hydrolase [Clostridia bacterium]|nr:aminoacyl-tRNA hydrolase [Clostridia bacterium]
MKLIVGLGNPGSEYERTRHNAGFMVIDHLAQKTGIKLNKTSHFSHWGRGTIAGEQVVLLKPQTYMNLSGNAVASISRWYKLSPADLLIIYDDLDLPLGKLRFREQGGAGGHRGLDSIISQLGTQKIPRLRIGIGRPQDKMEVVDYVLSPFTPDEKEQFDLVVRKAAEAVLVLIESGIGKAMNKYN